MIFIGGVSPKIRVLEEKPRICSSCGLARAYMKRMDYYLNLFFIPVLRIRKGEPFLECDACAQLPPGRRKTGADSTPDRISQTCSCLECGRALDPDFQFCPYCGRKI